MKVTTHLSRGKVTVGKMSDDGALALIDDFHRGDSPVITLTIDDAVTHIARAHIVRIDIDPDDTP